MKAYKTTQLWIALFLLIWSCPETVWAKLNVVTTTQDLAAIAQEVGGDRVKVDSIASGNQDYHFLAAKPSYMIKVNRADLLAYQGLELEVGWLPLLIRGGRNPNVLPGTPGHLDVSAAIVPQDVPQGQVDRSMGDVHPLGNPHYLLDPQNGIRAAQAFADRLGKLDPENAEVYQNNFKTFSRQIRIKISEWKQRLKPFSPKKVVTYHPTWTYLLNFFGIESVATVEDPPGVPPGSRHLAQTVNTMQQTGARVILQANYFERKFSDLLAAKARGQVLVLPASVGGENSVKTYTDLFDTLVDKLEEAFLETQSMFQPPRGFYG